MKLSQLIDREQLLSPPPMDREITAVTSRVEQLREGTLWFYLHGVHRDRSDRIPAALSQCPAAIVCEAGDPIPEGVPVLRVASSRRALAIACARLYGPTSSGMQLIGVTGTNGKTTTAVLIEHVLRHCGHRTGLLRTGGVYLMGESIGDPHYSMTTPDPEQLYPLLRRMQDAGCDTIVMEVSSHALALEKVAALHFRYALLTNLSAEHMDMHGSMEAYEAAKKKLFTQCEVAIVNADDPCGRRIASALPVPCLTVGALYPAAVSITEVVDCGMDGSEFLLRRGHCLTAVQLPLGGIYNIYNAALAMTCCQAMGVAPCRAAAAIAALPGVEGRTETVCAAPRVIIDYAHTPAALQSLLQTVHKNRRAGENIYLVFGCGGERDKEKRPVMAALAERYAIHSFVTEDNSRAEPPEQILRDILSGFTRQDSVTVIPDRVAAITTAIHTAREGDTVLIVGKGHERYVCDREGYHPFDERAVVRAAVQERQERKDSV